MQVQKRYGLFTAIAYEGWIVATSINAEMKNGRRDLPRALVLGLSLCAVWLLYFYGANLAPQSWFGVFSFDTSELPIITIYAAYLPVLVQFMRKERSLPARKRFVLPGLSVACCLFMMTAACFSHRMAVVYYLVVFAAVMAPGIAFAPRHKQ